MCCVWKERTLLLFACVQPRQSQGWGGSEDGVWPEHGVVRQSHCLREEHWKHVGASKVFVIACKVVANI